MMIIFLLLCAVYPLSEQADGEGGRPVDGGLKNGWHSEMK